MITEEQEKRLEQLQTQFYALIEDQVKLIMSKERIEHRYGQLGGERAAVGFEERTIYSAWNVLENEQNKDEIFKIMEQFIFKELDIQEEPTGEIIPELFNLLIGLPTNREILSVIANEHLINKAKYILTNILIDPALQVAYFKGKDRQDKFKNKFTQLTQGQAKDINIGIQQLENDGKTISVVCGATGTEMKRRELISTTNYQKNPIITVVGNRTKILLSEVLLMSKLMEYLEEQPELFTQCFMDDGKTHEDVIKLINALQTVEIPENFSSLEQVEKTKIINQYTKILSENKFNVEGAMQIKNWLEKNDKKEIQILRVDNNENVKDNNIILDAQKHYLIYNTTDIIQNKDSSITADTSSNANAILFAKKQYPNLLPNDAKYCIFANSAEENRMLRTFNTIFGNTDCVGAISDIKEEDISKTLDKTNTILAENVKLWHLNAEMGKMSQDDKLVSDEIKAIIG